MPAKVITILIWQIIKHTNIIIILGGSPADKLKEVYKPVLTDTECSTNIGGAFDPLYMMCAGYLEGGKGACQVRYMQIIKKIC